MPRIVTPAKAGVQTHAARGCVVLDCRLRGNDEGAGGGVVSGLAARGNDAGAALAPLTTHHAPYRHPRASGGPDGPHLPAATRNSRPRGCPRQSGGPDSRHGHPLVAPPPARGRPSDCSPSRSPHARNPHATASPYATRRSQDAYNGTTPRGLTAPQGGTPWPDVPRGVSFVQLKPYRSSHVAVWREPRGRRGAGW